MVEKAWPHIKVPHPDVLCEGAPIWHPRFGRGAILYVFPTGGTASTVFHCHGNMENATMGNVKVSELELVLDPRGCGILARWIRKCDGPALLGLKSWQWALLDCFSVGDYNVAAARLRRRAETPENANPAIFLNAMAMHALNALEGLAGGGDV